MILETLVVGPFMSNTYIVGSEKTRKGMIVDAGAEAGKILRCVQRHELTIEFIVATHTHIDHIAALKQVMEATGGKLSVHELEAKGQLLHSLSRVLGPFIGGSFDKMPEPDKQLKDGDVLEVGTLRFQVLHTPGHSPGGISLVGEGVVFTGDTLFNLGIGRTDFPGCSFDDLMHSINKKLLVLPGDTQVYPGHGPSTTISAERQYNPFLRVVT
ncbi:MAG: MBL fold metallo-hydrolase [Chloroflexi bacterium]|nr:MBL fold metallo-hydrolase [Chloroflexota bacterium]